MPDYVSSGSDFIVNTETGSHQFQARIARFADGSYVVVWTSLGSDPASPYSIRAQLFDAAGNRIGGEISVETHDNGSLLNPDVAVLADGSFMVVWQSEDSSHYGATRVIAGQHFSGTGTPIGGEFQVNPAGGAFVSAPSITALAGGSYVVSWDVFGANSVRAQVFAADGTALGGEVTIANHGQSYGTIHTIEALSSGGFVAVWNQSDGSGEGVRVQLFTSTGAEASGEFWANSQTTDHQSGASVVELANGNFVVVWSSSNTAQDGSFSAIKAQIFSAAGVPVGGEFLVNQIAAGYQGNAKVTALADGGFLVAWHSTAGTGSYDNTLQARVFDASGAAVGGEFQADGAGFTQWSRLGGIVTLPDGTVRLTYDTWGGDGDGDGVLVRTLVPQSATQTAPTIVSDGGGASALVLVNEYASLATNVRAIDPDGPVATTFAITGGADAARFEINPMTGRLQFVTRPEYANPADADGDNIYEVTVTASDGTLGDSQLIQVAVQDIVEAITVTSPTDVFTPENENLIYGGISATSSTGLPVYFMVIGGADAGLVTITQDGYFIFAPGFAPDFETPADADGDNVFEVTVVMGDGYASATVDVRIQVTDVSEPSFTSPSVVAMDENGSFVVTVQAVSETEYFLYTISGGSDAALFGISQMTGDLYFLNPPDFEFAADSDGDNVYQVEVTGWAQPSGLPATQLISVTIQNLVEAPVFYPFNIFHSFENVSSAGQVWAYSPAGNVVTYSIATIPGEQTDGAFFTIDANTGELLFLAAPDYEQPASFDGDNIYYLAVAATDQGSGDSATLWVTVQVFDVNEAPVITSGADFSVVENSTVVATITTSDPEGQQRTYSIVGGADAARFVIDANSGALSFVSAPNFEAPSDVGADNVYNVIVSASDGSLTATQNLAVTVTNLDESPTITSNGGGASAAVSLAENGTAVTVVTATDPDSTTRIFSIAGGADAARFAIDAVTGALSFIAAPNFEAPTDAGGDNVYDLIVAVSDGTTSDSQALAVTVGNVNEAPVITSGGGGASAAYVVNENNTAVATLTSNDPEATAPTWSIVGGADAARFTINANTGALSFVAAPNHEAPGDAGANNVYDVVVQASDGSLVDTQALSITVNNVIDGVTLNGNNSANTLTGTSAEDTINGNGGNDTITGGLGRDVLSGGSGADAFVFSSLADSLVADPDMILDFGNGSDRIRLSAIDANVNLTGDQAFTWIGTGNFTNVAGQLRYYQSGGDTFVTGDVNGDGVGDFLIRIDPLVTLSSGSFVL